MQSSEHEEIPPTQTLEDKMMKGLQQKLMSNTA